MNVFLLQLTDWCLLMRRKASEVEPYADNGSREGSSVPRRGSEGGGALTASTTTHRRKPFMEALYKAIELAAPEALDWTHDILHIDAASRSKARRQ